MATATVAKNGKHETVNRIADKLPPVEIVTIAPPNFVVVKVILRGTAPLMQARFSAKAMQQMMSKMAEGPSAKKGKNRTARDFDDDFKQAMHISTEGWIGVPAAAIRCACIDVCRMVGFKMTHAKMSIFTEADGYDKVDGMPLVKLHAGPPEKTEMAVRNQTGVADIRVRPMWREWELHPRIRFDEDQFKLADVVNLLSRAGQQVGLGEGRAFSRESNGIGYGFFEVSGAEVQK